MDAPPNEEEIRSQYRIFDKSLEFLSELPPPESLQKSGAWMELLGITKGYQVWILRGWNIGKSVIWLVAAYGGFRSGSDYLESDFHLSQNVSIYCDKAEDAAKFAAKQVTNAIEFAIKNPYTCSPDGGIFYDSGLLEPTSTTSTTTTTPPPSEPPSLLALQIGSGLVPYNPQWEGWT